VNSHVEEVDDFRPFQEKNTDEDAETIGEVYISLVPNPETVQINLNESD
jgi:hypothetical protein